MIDIMDAIVGAIIGAAAVIAVPLVTEVFLSKKVEGELGKHDAKLSEHDANLNGHDANLSKHDEKLNEHDKWAIQAKGELQTSLTEVKGELQTSLTKVEDRVQAVQQTLSADERLRQERLKNMTDRGRAIADSIDKLSDFSKEMQRLSLENAMLQKELAGLREENAQVQGRLQQLQSENAELRQENMKIREENSAPRQADPRIKGRERDGR